MSLQSGVFFWSLLKKVFAKGIKVGYVEFSLPDNTVTSFGRISPDEANRLCEPVSRVKIADWKVCLKLVKDSDVALGEAYMAEDIVCTEEELLSFLRVLIINSNTLYSSVEATGVSSLLYSFGNLLLSIKHALNKNTVAGSRRNIEAHYDLGNDMYKLFLDDTMTYSSGIHGALDEPTSRENLLLAQEAKLDNIINKLDVQEGDWILEIGCGWGSFAKRAAETKNCFVVGITISVEQLEYGRNLLKENGLEDRACLLLCDYRKLGTQAVCSFPLEFYGNSEFASKVYDKLTTPGSFDKVASIEMIEAVGDEHLNEYFGVINQMLKSRGRACLQAISVKDESYASYIKTSDFIRRHIFPGGCLVSLQRMKEAVDTPGNCLRVDDELTQDIGPDYATTLRMWRNLFMENLETIRNQGYPEPFIRKWIFYFIYCEAAFEVKYIHDFQVLFVKHANIPVSIQREHTKPIKSSDGQLKVKFQSVVFPAVLYLSGLVTQNPKMQDIGYVGLVGTIFSFCVLAVLSATPTASLQIFPSLFLCATYLICSFDMLPRCTLFAVFARNAIYAHDQPDQVLSGFLQLAAFAGAAYSHPSSVVVFGVGETLKFVSSLEQSEICRVAASDAAAAIFQLNQVASILCYLLPLLTLTVVGDLELLALPYVIMQVIGMCRACVNVYERYENMYNTNELIKKPAFKQEKEVLIMNMVK